GNGNDTIIESYSQGTDDRLMFTDINPADVTLVRNGNDLTVVIAESAPGAGDAGSVLIKETIDNYLGRGVDKIVFADGTTWTRAQIIQMVSTYTGTSGNDTLNGAGIADIIRGGLGNDIVNGAGGNDTYVYARGDGNDTITESFNQGTDDSLLFADVNPADVTLVRNGNDLTVVIAESAPGAGDTGSVLIKGTLNDYLGQGVDKIVFADGTTWTRAQIRELLLTNTSANQTFGGFSGNDTYHYARGDGNDTITESFNQGTDDRLVFTDINPADVTLVRNGNDLTVAIAESAPEAGDAGSVLIKGTLNDYLGQGVDKIVFADGTTWTRAQIRDLLLTNTFANQTFGGFSGNDTYHYARGDGNDTIIEAYSNGTDDRLVFTDINPADVTLVRNGNDLTVVIAESAPGAGDAGSVLIKETLIDYLGQGVDKVVFADGTTWTRADLRVVSTSGNDTFTGFSTTDIIDAGAGNDTIDGVGGNDTITGGSGNDVMTGGSGSDIFVFKPGFGHDTIIDFKAGAGTDDKLRFENGLFGNFTAVISASSQSGANTVIRLDSDNDITLKNVTLTNLHADDFLFVA
ncbi:calcium-binding protein, partial [Rhizobium herbae]